MTDITLSYDIFLSYNHADRDFVRRLARDLASLEFNGRHLRPWLDESMLNPGELAAPGELTSAIERSRFFGLVASPNAMQSKYVGLERDCFIKQRGVDDLLVMLRRECELDPSLAGLTSLDFCSDDAYPSAFSELAKELCPSGESTVESIRGEVDACFDEVQLSDPGGSDPGATPERDALGAVLTRFDVTELEVEGLAVTAFDQTAKRLLVAANTPSEYNCKMLVGECLAAAMRRTPGSSRIAQHLLSLAEEEGAGALLLFVIARAYSKLAEHAAQAIDTSVILRTCMQLDTLLVAGPDERATRAMLARATGKLRDDPPGEFLIKMLCEGGPSSRRVAAGAIALDTRPARSVAYLSEFELTGADDSVEGPCTPPSQRLIGELSGLAPDPRSELFREVELAKSELGKLFPGIEFPYGHLWGIRRGVPTLHAHSAPFLGAVIKATVANMEQRASDAGPTTLGCLTEPRVVDVLFERCSALLIPVQDPDSPQCRRLRDRGTPFAMLEDEAMEQIEDGDHIAVFEGGAVCWQNRI